MPNRIQIQIIKEAMDEPELLDDYENRFIDKMAEYPDKAELSEKQNKVLNKIGSKIARGGEE